MLDQVTKRKIDSARQILVGKVPDPKAQVEQITTALVYKFMYDMDKEAEELGGKAKFFTEDLKDYTWHKLLDRRYSGQERMDLYVRAISSFSTAKQLPQLFRDIFKDAFLPYRDPETLSLFLKEIDSFSYDHSENLGNAFEYLLSVLGSQGDAGQFRTPRHIIDFMVKIVDPKKNETVLDPACGTAGFLISSYKHIRKHNSSNFKPEKEEAKDKIKEGETAIEIVLQEKVSYRGDLLTPTEKEKVMQNIVGYDISPDMVKLSLVNLYLHGFSNPKIYEYDTLTSEKYWGEQFDVIMANPPFMSPKGGIRPHKRFSVQASRSEVLFVDYILEHLNLKGRAGIIVPEGIIFKSENAYKQLRQMLIEDGLFAVVSLPPGVFNPYAGVKTSILFFDNQFAKKTDEILFLKIKNDGFDLGAQRRKIGKNDLPKALEILEAWKQGKKQESDLALWAKKNKITENGDYSLNGEVYKETEVRKHQKWPLVELGQVCEINPSKSEVKDKSIEASFVPMSIVNENDPNFTPEETKKVKDVYNGYTYFKDDDILLAKITPCFENGKAGVAKALKNRIGFGSTEFIVLRAANKILPKLLYLYVKDERFREYAIPKMTGSAGQKRVPKNIVSKYKIPLPPLGIQKEIVEQIEVKQSAISHAKEIIKNLEKERRYLSQELRGLKDIELVEIGELCDLMTGGTPTSTIKEYYENGTIRWLVSGDIHKGEIIDCEGRITELGMKESNARLLPKDSVLIALNGQGKTRGTVAILRTEATCNQSLVAMIPKNNNTLIPEFLYIVLQGMYQEIRNITGDTQRRGLNMPLIRKIKIPFPPLEIQKQLLAEAKKEEEIIIANRRLIELMERKIKEKISNV